MSQRKRGEVVWVWVLGFFFSWQVAPSVLPSRERRGGGGGSGAMLLLFWARTPRFGVVAAVRQSRRALAAEALASKQGMERQVSARGGNLPLQPPGLSYPPGRAFSGQNLPRRQQGLAQAGLLRTSASPPPPPQPGPRHLRVEGPLGERGIGHEHDVLQRVPEMGGR